MDNNNQPTQDKAPTPPPFKPETSNATTVPSEWPGAFGIYEPSKKAVKLNLWLLIAVFLLSSLLSGITSSLNNSNGVGIGTLLSFLISPIITAMSSYILIESVRGKVTDFQTAFDKVSSKLLNIFIASILTGLISAASILFFVIPAFFVIPRICLVMYFVIDKDMDAVEAIKASWKYMDGNVSKAYGIAGVCLLIALTVIGIITIPITIYLGIMYSAAMVILYEYVIRKNNLK